MHINDIPLETTVMYTSPTGRSFPGRITNFDNERAFITEFTVYKLDVTMLFLRPANPRLDYIQLDADRFSIPQQSLQLERS
jgi:hypothetical protein